MFERPMILFIRKSYVLGAIITLFLLLGAYSLKMTSVFSSGLKDKVIVIDPGHGGADPGAQSSGLKEKDINLDISLRLSKVLAVKGCRVILTRETDKDFFQPGFVKGRMAKRAELNNRIRIAAENNADIFISIHANSFPKRNSYGMETYYHLKSPAGKALAEIIQEQLALVQPDNKRKAKAGDYYLLNQTEIPANIVEVGFISNSKERKLLQSEDYRSQVAEAIGNGVENYFKAYPTGVPDSAPTVAQDEPPAIKDNTYKLYFSSETFESLVPENREFNPSLWSKLDLAQKASLIMSELIQGPLSSKLNPTIAPTTKILSITTQNGVATIDFSKDIRDDFLGGALGEELTLRSIVWSMTQIPGISKVRILVNGEFGDSIGGHIFLDRTFSPQLGV
ncbi:N-acetylmuramoyl-L-alanine amidase [Desulfosporosinus orientis DSM 765]|uniref:N-acetylmuramoyl-L-alanine amidase n=1 Tax=Desulfosporosinus orientis (strain ATCC 19365 / DSM 765 / NCIMB 8382 / VKM B-1628 / Singapore I) TaxID=768706 RepID=G7WAW4_DESOD|nr:N-acetylmuramoyl-L-alanine amidase [Desulfosporosinus orientis]AET67175.1 N-acetylmuramoyl-L-alanine amidase [Desulfosporosinus orientis DSM 765]